MKTHHILRFFLINFIFWLNIDIISYFFRKINSPPAEQKSITSGLVEPKQKN